MDSELLFKNHKIKFREEDYVDKYYIRDGKGVIPIEINSMDDLYMKHDFQKLTLSDDLCDYIEEIAYIIPIEYAIILEIHCPTITKEEQERIKKVIKNNYGMEIDDRDYDVKISNQKAFILSILGIILLIIAFALEGKLPEIIREVIYIAGWVSLWEMFEALVLENSKKRVERINKLQLYDSEIRFVFDR